MRLLLILLCLALNLCMTVANASGGTTHQLVAMNAINELADPRLRNLLLNNLDAYLVGAYYPDSGYVEGATYGEDSHWDPFIDAFADYLKENYADPIDQNPKLVAFLFGCASHRVTDELSHWTFYNFIRDHDFKGDADAAHNYGDTGIDLLAIVDQRLWNSQPATWWVPVKDLVAVYHRMGRGNYTEEQIIKGNSVISLVGYGERMIAAPSYSYLHYWKMPWTASHYYNWNPAGLTMDQHEVSAYQTKLWQKLLQPTSKVNLVPRLAKATTYKAQPHLPAFACMESAIQSGAAYVRITYNADGSVNLTPSITGAIKSFSCLLD